MTPSEADSRLVDMAQEREVLSLFQRESIGRTIALAAGTLSREDQVKVDRFGEHPAFRPLLAGLERVGFEVLVLDPSDHDAIAALRPEDLVFVHMHGEFGEDGRLQGLLDYHGVTYTGSGVLASALGLDKDRFKRMLRGADLRTPDWRLLDPYRGLNDQVGETVAAMPGPWIVKPICGGSSIAMTLASTREELFVACKLALSDPAYPVFVEQFAAGEMVTVGVLQLPSTLVALPVVRVVLEGAVMDLETKLQMASQKLNGATLEVPAAIEDSVAIELGRAALDAHRLIGCAGFSRTDMILQEDGAIEILEINTIPGLSPGSSFARGASALGLSYDELLLAMVRSSWLPAPTLPGPSAVDRRIEES